VTNNNCAATFPNALLINGIHVAAGATAGPPVDNGTLCVTLTGNNVTGAGNAANGDADIRLRQRFSTTIRLPGYGGANNDTAAVNAFVAGNNDPNGGAPPAAPTVSSVQNVGGGGGGFVGGAACALPPLLAAGGEGPGAASITPAELASVTTEALGRWQASGISASDRAKLAAVSFGLADLEPGHLGGANATTVQIDSDAAGWGWYTDPTPADDGEFAMIDGELRAGTGSPAEGRMDLLTVVMHELGHVLGRDDLPIAEHPHDLMAENLPTSIRRMPVGMQAQAAPQAAGFPLNIGTLPAGKRVTITFDVMIGSLLPPSVTQVSNQGTVSGSNFAMLLTDDPDTAAPADPTITQLDQTVTTFRAYLPIAQREAGLPDLVIDRIVVTRTSIQVVIRNQGSAPVTDPFWVDAYINPKPAPSRVNQLWQMLAPQGLVWGVTGPALPLNPGETLTLSIGGAYYRPTLSNFAGSLAAGTPVYAQVDSANANTTYGAVFESDEQPGRSYNNISGPAAPTSAMRLASAAPTAGRSDDDVGLPARRVQPTK
jgi:hypothetical protein